VRTTSHWSLTSSRAAAEGRRPDHFQGKPPLQLKATPGTKAQRQINATDLEHATKTTIPMGSGQAGRL
jgi:hypothetical protein